MGKSNEGRDLVVGASQFTRCGCHGAHGPERPRRGGVITGSGKHTPPNQWQLPDALPRGSGLQLRREEQHFMTASLAGEKPGQNLPPAQGPLLPASSAALARLRLPGLPGGKAVPPQRFPDRPAAPQCVTPRQQVHFLGKSRGSYLRPTGQTHATAQTALTCHTHFFTNFPLKKNLFRWSPHGLSSEYLQLWKDPEALVQVPGSKGPGARWSRSRSPASPLTCSQWCPLYKLLYSSHLEHRFLMGGKSVFKLQFNVKITKTDVFLRR